MPETIADQSVNISTLIWLLAAAGLVALVWVATALFAFWRIGQQSARIEVLEETAALAEKALDQMNSRPIWIWADGRCEANPAALRLLNADFSIKTIDDLVLALNRWRSPFGDKMDWASWSANLLTVQEPPKLSYGGTPANRASDSDKDKMALARVITVKLDQLPGLQYHLPEQVLWVRQAEKISLPQDLSLKGVVEPTPQSLWSSFFLSPIPAAIVNESSQLIYVNKAYMEAVGVSEMQQVLSDQLHLTESPPLSLVGEANLHNEKATDTFFGLVRGERITMTCTAQRLHDGQLLVQYLDISEQTESRFEVTRLLSTQAELLNRIRTPIAIFSGDRTLQFFNDSFCRISKLDADWLGGSIDHSDVLDAMRANRRLPEQIDYQQWKAAKLSAYTRVIEAEEELWHLSDGSTIRVVTQPYLTDGLLLLFEDITDKLALERRYNTLIAVQQETLDNLQEAVAVFSEDARLRLGNAAFYYLWDIPKEPGVDPVSVESLGSRFQEKKADFFDMVGRPIEILECLPIWITNKQEKFGRVIMGGDSYLEYSLTILPDGGALWALNDTTSSERARKALVERNQALESADRMRTEFIASMSYELRTPLNSITGFAELLEMGVVGDLNERQRHYLQDILTAGDQLKGMISDVLDLAVLQSGQMELDLSSFDPAPVLEDAAAIAGEMLGRNSINVSGYIGELPTLVADRLRLKQIIVNLLTAFAVFAPRSSTLHYQVASNDTEITFIIDIYSCGPSPVQRDRIVASLSRGEMPESRRTTGISLSLARSIVGLHGGDVSIYSLDETGIRLATVLPLEGPRLVDTHLAARLAGASELDNA